jgi:hypothetical protein
MRRIHFKYFILIGIVVALSVTIHSCKKDINVAPVGSLSPGVLASKAGVDGLLIGAYSMLDGYTSLPANGYTSWETSMDNWVYGSVAADDAFKGSNTTDQPNIPPLVNHSLNASNEFLQEKWAFCYDAIQRANDAIREIPLVTDGSVTPEYAKEVIAEARFIRGVFHLELTKMFKNVPYVGEGITYAAKNYNLPNPGPIFDSIELDLTASMTDLPNTQPEVGRANHYAAEAFLAKTYMFEHKYSQALPLLTDIITNGTNSLGTKFALGAFEDNFDASKRNNPESVFCVQMTVNDGSGGQNSNPGAILNFPAGTYTGCCGFFQPSYTMGNAFKVDVNGLPLLGTTGGTPNYNLTLLTNDHGLIASDPFTPTAAPLDPRIDWTVGRRGIPYLDWGLCGGENWSRGDIVSYNPIKNVFWHKDMATTSENSVWGAPNQGTAINYNLIRLADVILWRAECEVEANDLTSAQADVNLIRDRMASHPEYWVHTYVDNSDPSKGFTNIPAANYQIKVYPAGAFTAMGQAGAREAVYMERQLELAMEGHRFFDLQRYDGVNGGPEPAGYMAGIENAYIKSETSWPPQNGGHAIINPVLVGHTFTQGVNEIYPIPQNEIDISAGPLKQNPGY